MLRSDLKELGRRFLFSLPFFAISGFMFSAGGLVALFAVFYLVIPAFIMAGPIASMVTGPVGGVFHPGRRTGGSMMYSIPEARIAHGRFDEAMDLYREMAIKSPNTTEIYLRMIRLAADLMEDMDLAHDVLSMGLRNLRDQKERETLAAEYRRLRNLPGPG